MEKIDLVLKMQEQQHSSILRVEEKLDDLGEKVGSDSVVMESRVTKLETVTSLRNRLIIAIAALLPAISVAVYFLTSS